ncbi:MAG: VIT and VWA domain-containing protein [Gemmatales bacterium]|nr:VIT and VWA domain-containing protein [Gemmatales bacterium]MDW8387330.1 VIT and VWA domain-containing protein [Gemmatales bacterium]
MTRLISALAVLLVGFSVVEARGVLIPTDRTMPPLTLLKHRVEVAIEDQVAVTKVEQTFRNPAPRPLEATYVFPVPRGASVREFAMWVDGKRVPGELVEAAKARQIYTDIVRRTYDPGLLEYIGQDVLQLRVFPVPPNGEQKIELSYTSIAKKDHDTAEYIYPLRMDARSTTTLEDFVLQLTLKSQQPIANIYSPSHPISINRTSDHAAVVGFEKGRAALDRDFQLFWTTGGQDVGVTILPHKPTTTEDGYVLLLLSPRPELAESQQVPRDLVFVLDTSGSMREDGKMDQAKKALKHCLDGLRDIDRFAVLNFATTVNRWRDGLTAVTPEQIDAAKKWIDRLEPSGGTAIDDALQQALALRPGDSGRAFTIVFLTDGKPTVGETNPDRILANVARHNVGQVRIFTFGVGHDLNAAFLDQLAENTRAAGTYVRPGEDMEAKVSSFFAKISKPVLADLRLTVSGAVTLSEMYPPTLPDLFHGGQLVVLARYHGSGTTQLTLSGSIGTQKREYVYTLDFPSKTDDKRFVEDLWARRKVGYLLEQIRLNGEKKELVDEVTALAKKYGIATPYTSYLVVPDEPVPIPMPRPRPPGVPPFPGPDVPVALQGGPKSPIGAAEGFRKVADLAKELKDRSNLSGAREAFEQQKLAGAAQAPGAAGAQAQADALRQKAALDEARAAFSGRDLRRAQENRLGVDLSLQISQLKGEAQSRRAAARQAAQRQMVEVGGVWIDEGFDPKMPQLVVKALSDGYFRLLDKRPELKEVFQLGNYLIYVTPSGTALIIDLNDGKEQLSDEEISKLFAKK